MAGTMHLSPSELTLYQMVEDEPWEGDVQSPSGAFAHVSITESMRDEVVATVGIDIGEALIGHWLIVEDEQGNLHFYLYPFESGMLKELAFRQQAHEAWDAS